MKTSDKTSAKTNASAHPLLTAEEAKAVASHLGIDVHNPPDLTMEYMKDLFRALEENRPWTRSQCIRVYAEMKKLKRQRDLFDQKCLKYAVEKSMANIQKIREEKLRQKKSTKEENSA